MGRHGPRGPPTWKIECLLPHGPFTIEGYGKGPVSTDAKHFSLHIRACRKEKWKYDGGWRRRRQQDDAEPPSSIPWLGPYPCVNCGEPVMYEGVRGRKGGRMVHASSSSVVVDASTEAAVLVSAKEGEGKKKEGEGTSSRKKKGRCNYPEIAKADWRRVGEQRKMRRELAAPSKMSWKVSCLICRTYEAMGIGNVLQASDMAEFRAHLAACKNGDGVEPRPMEVVTVLSAWAKHDAVYPESRVREGVVEVAMEEKT